AIVPQCGRECTVIGKNHIGAAVYYLAVEDGALALLAVPTMLCAVRFARDSSGFNGLQQFLFGGPVLQGAAHVGCHTLEQSPVPAAPNPMQPSRVRCLCRLSPPWLVIATQLWTV